MRTFSLALTRSCWCFECVEAWLDQSCIRPSEHALPLMRAQMLGSVLATFGVLIELIRAEVHMVRVDATNIALTLSFTSATTVDGLNGLITAIDNIILVWFNEHAKGTSCSELASAAISTELDLMIAVSLSSGNKPAIVDSSWLITHQSGNCS